MVKTTAEGYRIPRIQKNVTALQIAAQAAAATPREKPDPSVPDSETYAEARAMIEAVLNLGPSLGRGLARAFAAGYLDIPYCLHPDNGLRTGSYIDERGWLRWSRTGALPIAHIAKPNSRRESTSTELLQALSYVEQKYDRRDELSHLAEVTEQLANSQRVAQPGRPQRLLNP